MVRVAFVDDSKAVIAQLEEYMAAIPLSYVDCSFFYSGQELLTYMEKTKEPFHIYFLDISMPGIDGIRTAETIRSQDRHCVIIFLTDYKEFVYQVFEVLPFRFLRKPLDQPAFADIFMQALEHLQTFSSLFFFKIGRERFQIPYGEILYFEAQGRRVRLKMEEKEFLFYMKIREISRQVDNTLFVQCHVSYLVNMEQIQSISDRLVILKNGEQIPISKKYRQEVRSKHLDFVKWRCGK
ncbi:MAG: LytTR family DNA-binding domain-containing protein [Clostridiales Family XIII bacterium]|uniref:LytR/AlgR family response regulator transcription factor n=1 Tax=Hominibacterium faecale TaxID=2839743 RepID=UPI0022B2965F|nr:LytTR family DNA-binding domain-containing protein [Hominibacterium faecale]MCI7301366.1 LytTR family DNA-binding domain-containing protein [Clostridia bacterium]MDE8733603.1 LytTR family DNA-binding domain-containing protein [Eubacteriales bacterium DFI.9.88]MDY3011286.1 LytTR family DNA-binding domain-containing protein [Clostridiales Family XIII bacterium]